VKPFHFWMPTEIVVGVDCLNELAQRSAPFGNRPLLVTGRHSARSSGAFECVLSQLVGTTLVEGIEENPSSQTCERGAELCRKAGCDFVVALGGGSAIDAAKAIAVLATNDGTCDRYFGSNQYSAAPLPIVAIPTTAGTGSEVTPYSVLVDSRTRTKRTIAGKGLFPRLALLDPGTTVTMSRATTIYSGLDALSQAMEGMVSKQYTPMGDVLALEVCRVVAQWLPVAAEEPAHLDARMQMLYAAMLSGCVIAQSGTTLVHGMGYPLTLEFGLPHGLANALLLTPVFQYNARFLPEKVAAIAHALGVVHGDSPTAEEAAANVGQALHRLFQRLKLSPAARDAGVDGTQLQTITGALVADRSRFRNQPGEPTAEDVLDFYRRAWNGTP